MLIVRIVLFIIGFVIVSAGMGLIPAVGICGLDRKKVPVWAFACGVLCMWGLFQVVSVPFILMNRPFEEVVLLYGILTVLWLAVSLILFFAYKKKRGGFVRVGNPLSKREYALWGIFVLLLVFQLFQAVFLAYADGDDAYYIGVAAVTESSDTMYRIIPYTGETTTLDVRHGLAPFPIWIAFLSRICDCPVAVMSHIVLPLLLIPVTYLIYALIGSRIIRDKKQLPVYLILLEVLILWGNYSFFTAETFLLARSRQGKAAVANIVIPFLLLVLYLIGEKVQEKKKVGGALWFLLAVTTTASCLCTTLGSFFSCLLIGLSGICMAVSYKNYKNLIPLFLCCVPAIVYFGLFVVLQ